MRSEQSSIVADVGKDGYHNYQSAQYRASLVDPSCRRMSWRSYYSMSISSLEDEIRNSPDPAGIVTSIYIIKAEVRWHHNGMPEYKIHKEMADAMIKTSLDIDCTHLKLPYQEFVIRMPIGSSIESVFVIEPSQGGAYVSAYLRGGVPLTYKLRLTSGETIGSEIDHLAAVYDRQISKPMDSADLIASVRDVLCLIVATCFFATGRDRQQRFVTQDKPANHHERRVLAKAQKCRTSEIVLPPKFTVGQDVVLPKFEPGLAPPKSTPEPTAQCAECKHLFSDHSLANLACAVDGDPACPCEEFDTGRHLERGHIRSGHLHWYATGPRKPGPGEKNDYVLKWVAPTVVRPDLPLAPVRSRIIKTPVNKIVSHTGDIET